VTISECLTDAAAANPKMGAWLPLALQSLLEIDIKASRRPANSERPG
jgi:hypothetical protein